MCPEIVKSYLLPVKVDNGDPMRESETAVEAGGRWVFPCHPLRLPLLASCGVVGDDWRQQLGGAEATIPPTSATAPSCFPSHWLSQHMRVSAEDGIRCVCGRGEMGCLRLRRGLPRDWVPVAVSQSTATPLQNLVSSLRCLFLNKIVTNALAPFLQRKMVY